MLPNIYTISQYDTYYKHTEYNIIKLTEYNIEKYINNWIHDAISVIVLLLIESWIQFCFWSLNLLLLIL